MKRYAKTCQICRKPFSEVGICCDSGADGEGGHINGRCPDCCHGRAAIARLSYDEKMKEANP